MGYTACFRPGMEDLNPDLSVKNRSLLRMCEDTAGFHTDSVGDGLGTMNQTGYAWILMAWQLSVLKRPVYGQLLTVTTRPREMARVHAWRDFSIFDEAGSLMAEAASKWIVVQTDNHAVIRIPPVMKELYPEEPGGSLTGWRPMRPVLPQPELIIRESETVIRRSDTDLLGHLHNLCYLDMAEDMLPSECGVPGAFNHVTVVYRTETKAGDTVRNLYYRNGDRHMVCMAGSEDICAQIELW